MDIQVKEEMYANGNPLKYLKGIKSSTLSMIAENIPEGKNISLIGVAVYLLSFLLPAAGTTGTGLGVFTALVGSVMISKPLVLSGEFGEPGVFEKWGNYRIDGPPEDEKEREEKGPEEAPSGGRDSQRPLHGIKSIIDFEEQKEDSDIFEQAEIRDREEIPEIPEEYTIAEEDEIEGGEQYDRMRPLVKTSGAELLIFRTGEENILSLPKKKESFNCPVCGERVSWDTTKCPSCGVMFASLESRLDDVIREEIDEYGRSILPADIKVKAIHLDMENGSATIYGSVKKREERKDTYGPYGSNDDFLAGISAID